MKDWKFYVPRSITTNGKFDPCQIEDGLRIGLLPQILIILDLKNPDVISSLYRYLNGKGLDNSTLVLHSHGKGEFGGTQNLSKVYDCIDTVVELNKKWGANIIRDIVFHAGSVHSFKEECEIKRENPYEKLAATFTPDEYIREVKKIREGVAAARAYGKEHGIDLIVENVGQVDFAVVPTMKLGDKPRKHMSDKRYNDSIWLPEPLQIGSIGCVYDLPGIVGEGSVCIDVEHLEQSVEYSRKYNLSNYPKTLDEKERSLLASQGVFIRKGEPILFEKKVRPEEVIGNYKGRIPLSHLGGQTSMAYKDRGTTKIGSHMPITFGEQENEFIDDPEVRRTHNLQCEKNMRLYLGALHEAGCRSAVLEMHFGAIYTGPLWRKYVECSLRNVQEIINGL